MVKSKTINLKDKTFVVYTDGVTEGYLKNGEELGAEGVQRIVKTLDNITPKKLVDSIANELNWGAEKLRDDITFVVSKLRWDRLISSNTDLQTTKRPNEGDLVYFPTTKAFFEIQFVEDQEPFYQLGNLPVYKLKVTRWEYSSEKLDTGQESIDQHEDTHTLDQLQYRVSLEYGQEVLTGAGSITLEDYFDHATGQPSFLMKEDFTESNIQTQSPYADNLDLNKEAGYDTVSTADDILDFTERNPFGEIDE